MDQNYWVSSLCKIHCCTVLFNTVIKITFEISLIIEILKVINITLAPTVIGVTQKIWVIPHDGTYLIQFWLGIKQVNLRGDEGGKFCPWLGTLLIASKRLVLMRMSSGDCVLHFSLASVKIGSDIPSRNCQWNLFVFCPMVCVGIFVFLCYLCGYDCLLVQHCSLEHLGFSYIP